MFREKIISTHLMMLGLADVAEATSKGLERWPKSDVA